MYAIKDLPWGRLCGLLLAVSVIWAAPAAHANDNPALGIGEPNTTPDPPPDDPPCMAPPCDQCNASGSPVFLVSGTLFRTFNDLDFGLVDSLGFAIGRTYNSDDFYIGLFGRGFHSTLDLMSIPTFKGQADGEIVVVRWPEGQRAAFTKQPGGQYSGSVGRDETLTKVPGGFVLQTREEVVYTFDSAGRLLQWEDRNGNAIVFANDAHGRPQTITLSGGRMITIGYNASGLIDAITDFAGRQVAYGYDANGYLTSFTDASAQTWRYEYGAGLLARIIDPANQTVLSVTYNAQRRVSRIVDSEGDFTYTYLSATQTRKTDNSTGGQWTYTFDGRGVVTRIVDPLGGTTQYTYDGMYNLTSVRDANNRLHTFAYDGQGRILSETDPLNNVISYTYDAQGRLQTATDERGIVTRHEYDAAGNRTRIIEALGNPLERSTLFVYDAAGNLTGVTDASGTTNYEYDAAGRATRRTDALGHAEDYGYDAAGNRTSVADAAGTTTTVYDAFGHPIAVTDPAGNTTGFSYDDAGRLIAATDGENNTTTYGYDVYGRLTLVTDPLMNATTMAYDAAGRRTSVVDANGKQRQYAYDLAGRLTRETNPRNQPTQYGYDPVGNRTSITDANNNAMTLLYDGADRLTRINYPGGSFEQFTYNGLELPASRMDRNGHATTLTHDALRRLTQTMYFDGAIETYSYDASGNLVEAENASATLTFTYDALGHALTETNSTFGKTLTYMYDGVGRRATLADSDGLDLTYQYGPNRRLARIASPTLGDFTFAYDGAGRRTQKTRPNGVATEFVYQETGRLLEVDHSRSDASALMSFLYTLDGAGNRTSLTDGTGVHTYMYDNVYELTSATHPNPAVNPNETYAYDPVGNRLSSHLSSAYSYNAVNQLLSDDDFTYTYDNNGNLLSATPAGGGPGTLYAYGPSNRLVRVDLPGGTVITYAYDALGRRVEKNVGGVITRYAWDRNDILAEYDGVGALVAHYIHGAGIDDPLAMRRAGASYYYLEDGLGTIRALVDSGENIVNQYEYDSFGRIVESSGAVLNPYTFTARELDGESGLYHYRARAYDSSSGRFIQVDPLLDEGWSSYVYAQNNPIVRKDPTGLGSCTCGEPITQVLAVGPFDARTARNLANDALAAAQSSGLPGLHNGQADAFRHCFWSCRMAQEIGAGQAKQVGDIHEDCGGNPPGERAMDEFNNRAGRGYGTSGANCRTLCMTAATNGTLQTSVGGTPGSGYKY